MKNLFIVFFLSYEEMFFRLTFKVLPDKTFHGLLCIKQATLRGFFIQHVKPLVALCARHLPGRENMWLSFLNHDEKHHFTLHHIKHDAQLLLLFSESQEVFFLSDCEVLPLIITYLSQ